MIRVYDGAICSADLWLVFSPPWKLVLNDNFKKKSLIVFCGSGCCITLLKVYSWFSQKWIFMQSSLIIGRDQPLINGSTINARDGKSADWLWLIENVELELDSKEASCCSAYPIPDGRCDPDGNSGPERMGKGRLERTEVNLVCELVLSTLLKSHLSQVRGFPLASPPLCLPLLHLGISFINKIEAGNFTKHHIFFFFYKNSSNSWGDRTYQELMSFLHVVTSFDFFFPVEISCFWGPDRDPTGAWSPRIQWPGLGLYLWSYEEEALRDCLFSLPPLPFLYVSAA